VGQNWSRCNNRPTAYNYLGTIETATSDGTCENEVKTRIAVAKEAFWQGVGWGLQTPNLVEEEAYGVGDGTVRKSVGEFV